VIIGATVGVVAGIALLILAVTLYILKGRKKTDEDIYYGSFFVCCFSFPLLTRVVCLEPETFVNTSSFQSPNFVFRNASKASGVGSGLNAEKRMTELYSVRRNSKLRSFEFLHSFFCVFAARLHPRRRITWLRSSTSSTKKKKFFFHSAFTLFFFFHSSC